MNLHPHALQDLKYCPVRIYLTIGLGLKPKPTKEMEIGKQAHRAYQLLTLALARKGEITEEDLEAAAKEAPGLPREEIEKIAQFRASTLPPRASIQIELDVEVSGLPLKGKIDILENEAPVEVKYKAQATAPDIQQALLYMYMLEKTKDKKVEKAYIDLLKKPARIQLKRPTTWKPIEKLLQRLAEAAAQPIMPPNPPCRKCNLKRECRLFLLHQP